MTLALGTVQFGVPYGIANESGQPTQADVAVVLRRAWSGGLRMIDTAIAYGDSERRLGQADVRQWSIVTKLPAVNDDEVDVEARVQASVQGSLERLGVSRVYGLLLHKPDQLLARSGLYRALQAVKQQGLVEKIGISIYDPAELDLLVPQFEFDIVQAPFNLVDARLLESGWMSRLAGSGVELHVRSVFLQGLLLMPPSRRPAQFDRWSSLLETYDDWLDACGTTPLEACLRYALGFPEIARVIVGVDTVAQLDQVLAASSGNAPEVPVALHCRDLDLLNPARWATL